MKSDFDAPMPDVFSVSAKVGADSLFVDFVERNGGDREESFFRAVCALALSVGIKKSSIKRNIPLVSLEDIIASRKHSRDTQPIRNVRRFFSGKKASDK